MRPICYLAHCMLNAHAKVDEGARCDDSTGSTPAAVGTELLSLNVCPAPGRFGGAFLFPAGLVHGGGAALQPQQLTVMLWLRASQSPGPSRYLLADGRRRRFPRRGAR